ncbi:MAG: hypothetical protein PHX18_05865 [Candidatus Gastranaerophilales bacterium]|nr:hypothetical protein [Candidatus Gastranaerophilales bacterium]
MSVNFSNINTNIGTTYTGIVTGAELESVSREIFGESKIQVNPQVQTTQQTTVAPQVNTQITPLEQQTQINVYEKGAQIDVTQKVAQAKADFNVQLSPQALQNIEALKSLAITQFMQTHKIVDGKIFIPADNVVKKSDVETAFALKSPTTTQNAFSLEKDRKGGNPFAYTKIIKLDNEDEETETKSVNFFA